jgi:superfamily II DNA or RNA helicase
VSARRGVNTLVLVHRTELLKQWQERLQTFLGIGKGVVGTIGGGKAKPTGKIDIAVMQSVSRQGEVNPLVENYGLVTSTSSTSATTSAPSPSTRSSSEPRRSTCWA